jgi:E3 ubiquitin-protein ligase HUWE1
MSAIDAVLAGVSEICQRAAGDDLLRSLQFHDIPQISLFAKAYRSALNFLLLANNQPTTSLDVGIAFLLRSPDIVDFTVRESAFRARVEALRDSQLDTEISVQISRSALLESSFAALDLIQEGSPGAALLMNVSVNFVNEEAVDAGGVTREWVTTFFQELAQSSTHPLLIRSDGGQMEVNPAVPLTEQNLKYYYLLGFMMGFAVANEIPIDIRFSRAMYCHLVGRQPSVADLQVVDPTMYHALSAIHRMASTCEFDALGQTFVASGVDGAEIPLIPNGENIQVTNDNKRQYIELIVKYRLGGHVAQQLEKILSGFYRMIDLDLIIGFTPNDMEIICCGLAEIDVEDMRANTKYEGYSIASPPVRWFWECLATMSKSELAQLLQFSTALSRVPSGGFRALDPQLQIMRVAGSDRLPVAHTCMNVIELPEYESSSQLRAKLRLAITLGTTGFGLA